jgi:hypothetical protein
MTIMQTTAGNVIKVHAHQLSSHGQEEAHANSERVCIG